MSRYDLSILIPARNEQFVMDTVQDILKNKRGRTEVIVGLDGAWADPGIPDHPDVRIVYKSESIGQRAMTNLLCRMSDSKYVAKCDAHVAFSEGFDTILMNDMHDDWTMVPVLKNLHAFDWKCMKCGKRTYQGPRPTKCEDCDNTDNFTQKTVFKPKQRTPNSTAFVFNTNLQFWYFNELKRIQDKSSDDIVETMSLQGSFFMLTRDKYWELNICDENWGSWGQQGTEVALKTWLSGGRVVCNKKVWYAHMFRTQDGFSFPYPLSGSSQARARKISQDLFFNNNWDKQTRPLSWLLEKFKEPLLEYRDRGNNNWTEERIEQLKKVPLQGISPPTKGIIYYSDNRLPEKIDEAVKKRIREIGLPIVSCTLKPVDKMGENIVLDLKRGYLTMFTQILTALENSDADIIYFCEHDVLYHDTHFEKIPESKDSFYYNQNWWKVREDGLAVSWDADQVSGLCCYRDIAIEWYKKRIETFDSDNFDRKFEPMSGEGSVSWESEYPNIDIRTGHNLTYNKWSLDDFRNKATAINFRESTVDKIEGWTDLNAILR